MKRSTNNHTTVILLLSDGRHIVSERCYEAKSSDIWNDVRQSLSTLNDGVYVYEMFLACGVQSLRYTAGEVLELAAKE